MDAERLDLDDGDKVQVVSASGVPFVYPAYLLKGGAAHHLAEANEKLHVLHFRPWEGLATHGDPGGWSHHSDSRIIKVT